MIPQVRLFTLYDLSALENYEFISPKGELNGPY